MSRILGVLGVVGLVAIGWLPAGNGFRGAVRDVDGNPVAGAWIEARQVAHATLDPSDFEGEPSQGLRSAADGAYSLRDLGPGTWIVTAVGSATPRTDDEMKDLARSGAKGPMPAGVAVTRLLRHYADGSHMVEILDLGLAPAAERSFQGRLVGVFDHDHFGYEVQYEHPHITHMPPGTHTVTESVTIINGEVSGSSALSSPARFSAVPAADGRFDFGRLALNELDSITVEAFPLPPGDPSLRNSVYRGQVSKLEYGEAGVALPLLALRTVTLRAAGLQDGIAGEQPEFTVWDEQGSRRTLQVSTQGADAGAKRLMLPAGNYLVRASATGQTSNIRPLRLDAAGEIPDVVLELLPELHNDILLVDEAGQPITGAWVYIGTEATSGFANAFPLFSVTDEAGKLSRMALPAGKYRAQLVHEKGSYEEWRVNFDIDVADPQGAVTVPLSKKVKTYPMGDPARTPSGK